MTTTIVIHPFTPTPGIIQWLGLQYLLANVCESKIHVLGIKELTELCKAFIIHGITLTIIPAPG